MILGKMIGKFYSINRLKENILWGGLIVHQFLSTIKFICLEVEMK